MVGGEDCRAVDCAWEECLKAKLDLYPSPRLPSVPLGHPSPVTMLLWGRTSSRPPIAAGEFCINTARKCVWGSKQLSAYLNMFTFLKLYWIGCWWEWTQRRGKSCFSSPQSVPAGDAHDMLSVARRLAIRNPPQTAIGVKSLSFSHECQPCLGVMKLPRMQSHSL